MLDWVFLLKFTMECTFHLRANKLDSGCSKWEFYGRHVVTHSGTLVEYPLCFYTCSGLSSGGKASESSACLPTMNQIRIFLCASWCTFYSWTSRHRQHSSSFQCALLRDVLVHDSSTKIKNVSQCQHSLISSAFWQMFKLFDLSVILSGQKSSPRFQRQTFSPPLPNER